MDGGDSAGGGGGTERAASERQRAIMQTAEAHTLRRTFCLDNILRALADGGVSLPRDRDGVYEAPAMSVNRREGYVELLLPIQGRIQLARMNLDGMTDHAMQTYEAIHNTLAGMTPTSAKSEAERATALAGSQRRHSFFSALPYAPPSASLSRDGRCLSSSSSSPSGGNEADEGTVTAMDGHQKRGKVVVVEIADTVASAHVRGPSATTLSQSSRASGDGDCITSRAQTAPSTLGTTKKGSIVTVDEEEDGGGGGEAPELTPRPREPPPQVDANSSSNTGGGVATANPNEDECSPARSRQGTPSQMKRELDELFPYPCRHGESRRGGESAQDASTTGAMMTTAISAGVGLVDGGGGRGRGPAQRSGRRGSGGAQGRQMSANEMPRPTATRRSAAKMVAGPAGAHMGPGRDLLRELYGVPHADSSGALLPPQQPLGKVNQEEAAPPVSHLRTLRRRTRDYERFAEDEAYAARTYGVPHHHHGEDEEDDAPVGVDPGTSLTPTAQRARRKDSHNTPREYWDITFSRRPTPPPPPPRGKH